MRLRAAIPLLVLVLVGRSADAAAGDIASADLRIAGSSLSVVDTEVETGIDIPTTIQTEFGGKRNDEAPFVPGLLAMAELSGPGLDAPITLETAPGHAFRIPGLRIEGQYTLQNIRLTKDGRFLQPATPPAAEIRVADVLKTSVKVRQLTAEDLRVRGISLDGGNYDYYEYTFSVTLASGETVEVPYVVAIDPSTHHARAVVEETPYSLPPDREKAPPRWSPPTVAAFEFVSETEMPVIPQSPLDPAPRVSRPSIPAAIVIPNDIAVLHQFFGVGLMVRNGASAGSSIALDSISATIHIPSELRVAKTDPTVSFGQAVPILDADGTTILAAQAEGNAEWILEALRAGSFTIEFDLRATYRTPGQPDVPLRASPKTSILVHDPRFNITFSHPDVVREGIEYSTFSFVTNMSPATQSVRVSSGVKKCVEGFTANVCLVDGVPEFHDLTLAPGDTKIVEYVFRPAITGHAFASAGSVEGDAVTAGVRFHMGVDENGIPLSPATLLLPHYTRYLDPALVGAQLELLGLGYSLAIAPLNQTTAKFPRVIRTDVFERAADLARAGQRLFIGEPEELALFGMNLALLGNEVELREWDDLRRLVDSGRSAQAAIAQRFEKVSIATASDYAAFASRIAAANAHRSPFLAAIAHAPAGVERPFAVTLRGSTTGRQTGFAADANEKWAADLPFADVTDLDPHDGGAAGALALVGRWTEAVELIVTPLTSGPVTIELVHPAAAEGGLFRTTLSFTGTAGEPVTVALSPAQAQVEARNAAGAILAVATPSEKAAPPLQPVAARQDLHLDEDGHRVSVLFNRPIAGDENLSREFTSRVFFNGDGISVDRPRPISGAAVQADGRIVNLNFDHILSANATYAITVGTVMDPLTEALVSVAATVQPAVDNARQAALLYGKVLRADNTPVDDAEVALSVYSRESLPRPDSVQFDAADDDGVFFFEYAPRDPDQGYDGAWRLDAVDANGKATSTSAAVRTPGAVQFVNLVYLGRGSAEGYVRYEDGTKAAGVAVVVGSTMFNESRRATADANGFYRVENLPVGPLTFSATDSRGRIVYAANEVRTAGAVVVQDLVIPLGEAPGTGSVRGIVTRSDTNDPVAGARVGIYSRGYAVGETYTATDGRFEFESVPAGFVTVLAAEWSVSRVSAAQDFDLRPDSVRELTMILEIQPPDSRARVEGTVTREDPLDPGGPADLVPGALVKIEDLASVTADAAGVFAIDGVPPSRAGRTIRAYDQTSGRSGSATLPSPLSETTQVAIFIPSKSSGKGTIRVKLLSAAGFPVDGFDVFIPGFPKKDLERRGDGVYELTDVPVGRAETIWAVANSGGYGHQHATGTARIAFDGHVAPLNLRLPGQGRVRVAVRSDIELITDVEIRYLVWRESEQSLGSESTTISTVDAGGAAGYAIFDGIPVLGQFTVSSVHPVHGNASASGRLAFDGDLQTYTLQLDRLASLDGVVYAIDGRTPIAGALVRLVDGRQDQGATLTALDGTFSFRNLPAGASVQTIASVTQDGIYRTGYANAKTPAGGGAIENVGIVLRRRGTVEGQVVYAAYRVFDPNDFSKNVPDDTPEDLSDNAPVPLARLWLRELGFPARSFGSVAEPLTADASGRFELGNIFEGALRASAWETGNQELRGNWTGQIADEGDRVVALIGIGGAGIGAIEASVLDPNEADVPVLNAEVLLLRKRSSSWVAFDFASTDGAGKALFEQVPAGDYRVQAYSKAGGRSGASGVVTVVPNEQADARVLLEFIGKVSGQVIDREKQPIGVAGSHVTLDAFDWETRTTTDDGGDFLFEGVREGTFKLTARDPDSNRRAETTRVLSPSDGELSGILLELEPTEMLHAGVYLPADDGADSGVLAPAINVDVKQRCSTSNWIEFCDFYTSLQENPINVAGMLRSGKYVLAIREIGGEQRTISFSGSFPKGSAADPLRLVLPAFGSVRVQVIQGGQPAAGARVTAAGGGKQATAYTDAAGFALLGGLRLGPSISIQVRSLDGAFSGSTSATIASQSAPATAMVELGSYAGLSGSVEAESGGPSVGTRVGATFLGRSLDTLTNGEGRYQFHGIPTSASGTSVALAYIGPDEVTVGAEQAAILRNEQSGTSLELPPVRLDATPPRLISFTPADGSALVSPDAILQFLFSEPLRSSQLDTTYFKVIPAGSSTSVAMAFASVAHPDGSFLVTLAPPPAPPGQKFPLKSDTLYRIIVSADLADATGNRMGTARGGSFTTSDYAEPRVVKVDPAAEVPLQAATTFRISFSEPMDPAPWAAGGSGSMRLQRIAARGGAVVEEKTGRGYLDPGSLDTLVFAPDHPIVAEAFYRLTVTGARDPQGNVAPDQNWEWASFDTTPPHVILPTPAPPGEPLISGVEYTLQPDIRNGSATGSPATDIEQVEFFRVDGEAETYLTKKTAAPFSYRFVAPDAPAEGTTIAFRAIARDRSLNSSAPATLTLPVRRNEAPRNLAVTLDPSSFYAATLITANVGFADEGTLVVVEVSLEGTKADGSVWKLVKSKQVTRSTMADPWPAASIAFDVPPFAPGTSVTATARATDVRGLSATTAATASVLVDSNPPTVAIVEPAGDAPPFDEGSGNTIPVRVTARDAEVAVRSVTASVEGGETVGLMKGSGDDWSGAVAVPAVEGSEVVPRGLTIVAADHAANEARATVGIRITPLYDPNAPVVSWVCPTSGSLVPAGYSIRLRIRALGNDLGMPTNGVQKVEFFVGESTTAIVGNAVAGLADHYEGVHSLAAGLAEGTTITARAVVTNVAGSTNRGSMSFTIVSGTVLSVDTTIDSSNAAGFQGTLIVAGGKTTISGAQQFGRVIVLDGAKVVPPAGGVFEFSATELVVGCGGAVDASGMGSTGEVAIAGEEPAIRGSGGSHLGEGGLDDGSGYYSAPGTAFGNVTRPREVGGGGGYAAGGAGGGAIEIRAGRLDIQGAIRANGDAGVSAGAGAGGSIRIAADRIEGNGVLEARGGSGAYSGGGGGAIAIDYAAASSGAWTASAAGGSCCGKDVRNGAPGTVWIKGPSSIHGDLTIDSGGAFSTHPTRLSSLGKERIAEATGRVARLTEPGWAAESRVGEWVEVRGADGTLRGRWPIESVANAGRIVEPQKGSVLTQDGVSYQGYLVYIGRTQLSRFGATSSYSDASHLIAARLANGAWQFDNNTKFITFAPEPEDRVFATFSTSGGSIRSVEQVPCDSNGCPAIAGMAAARQVRGRILPNVDGTARSNPAEIYLNGMVLSDGPPAITLADVPGAPVAIQPGDSIRGLLQFDAVVLRNAVVQADLLRWTNLDADSQSSFVGNNEAPVVVTDRISLVNGALGPSVVGAPAAISDADIPLVAIVRNERTRADFEGPVGADGSFTIALSGMPGDAITIAARDSHAVYPLQSARVSVGSLSTSVPEPVRLGVASWGVDAAFRARTVVRDGSILAVASYEADGAGGSSRFALFDLANPAAPVFRGALAGTGEIRDVAVSDGWAFVAASRFWAVDLTAATPVPVYATDVCGTEYAVAVAGGFAFAAEGDCDSNNYINVYDVSTPSAPRYLYKKSIGTYTPYAFRDLFALGTDWLIGISDFRPGNVGHDLIVIDRRDPNDLGKIAELEVENFDAFRGALHGNVLWVVSRTSSEVATFDVSNPEEPALIARAYAGAQPNGITIAGGYAVVASGGSGLFAFDASDPTLMTRAGTATVAGMAWDVAAMSGKLYVADDTGLSIVPVNIGPVVDASRIRVEVGSETATVSGLPLAVTGGPSPAVEVTGPDGSGAGSVASDGSFSLTVSGRSGQALTLTVRNGDGRVTTHPLRIPFAASVEVLGATPAQAGNDASYRARRLATDERYVVATTGGYYSIPDAATGTALLFTLPNASAPVSVASSATALGDLWEVEVVNGWAYMTGSLFGSWNLSAGTSVTKGDQNPCGTERGLAVSGAVAFTAKANCSDNGTIFTWDVSSPGSPRLIGTSVTGVAGMYYRTLLTAGDGLLIGISLDRPGGVGRDVTIIDRSNPTALVRLAHLDIPNFDGVDGVVHGSILYVAGLDSGIAIVDISNPTAPQHLATIDTPGIARAVAMSGPDEIVVADGGGPGLTFVDVADKTRPVVLGSQPLVGNATDVRVIGSEIIVATDHHVQIVRRP